MEYVEWRGKQRRLISKKLMPDNKSSDWLQYSGIGIQMVATMMICWWLGEKLESYFKLLNAPWGQVGGLFFGVFASIYNLIKQVK